MTTIVQNESAVSRRPAGTSSRGKRLLSRIGRGLLWIAIALIALVAVGITYELIMSAGDAQRYPPPGQMVDAGGHRLHINCVGEGSPTVILEAGSSDTSLNWEPIQAPLAQTTRVCAYDRAGLGWSEAGPLPRSPQQIAAELHTALTHAGIEGPYVLVGHSIGGKHARMFAALYPQEVAGVVLDDARHESLEPVGRTPEQNEQDRATFRESLRLYEILGRLGIARAFGASLVSALNPTTDVLSPETRGMMALFLSRASTIETLVAESAGDTMNDDQLSASSLGDLPLVVLVSGEGASTPGWMPAQEKNAALSTNSRLMVVEGSTHNIHWTNADVVIDAIRQVIESAHSGQPLAP